ncbi:MAG: histidinol dehydrogenase [Gammaproteobacteria bacterium]|jgi:histidinol dehydrogenase|nr:histidinol dehydrogenase [Gammaproteobacteria bacterium]
MNSALTPVLNIRVWSQLDTAQQMTALQRPGRQRDPQVTQAVTEIIAAVREHGDAAIDALGRRFDGVVAKPLQIDPALWEQAEQSLPQALLQAMHNAARRIRRFHEQAKPRGFCVDTADGVQCQMQYRPIDSVGLYVPAGSAPLPSTLLMLAIPARIAGCRHLIVCSPPGPNGRPDATVLAAARFCDVDQVYAIGGAQAIAAMAYGTASVPRCDKLFGPGNRYVTEAKQQVSIDADGAAIDMPAGPSEVLVIADHTARPDWVAADLLSQAEHGPDSQVMLVCTSTAFATQVNAALADQLSRLPRAGIAREALADSRAIVVADLAEALMISNRYAPEHLILCADTAAELVADIRCAGSVFVGHYTPETLGDYCSGTNHVLPTAGWARSHGSLSTADFMLRMTVQHASAAGLANIGPDAALLAEHEQLHAHAEAVRLRLRSSP